MVRALTPTVARRAGSRSAVRAVGAAVAGFHALKLTGLCVNLVAFPVLRRGTVSRIRPRVSLLVPARDEEDRLPAALPGLLAQPAEEILVVDDGSRDATAAVVEAVDDRRLRLLRGTPPPVGWVGKNWACQQVADAATGDVLVFCDADVRLAPGALDAVLARMEAERADVLSVFPRQVTGTLGERMLVPLIDEVLLAFLPYPLLRLPVPAAATANGQLLAFRRDAYRRLGGHAAVRGEVVEDLALGRRTRRAGLRLSLALGGELVSARLYTGYRETVRGFAKSLRGAHGGSRLAVVADLGWHVVACTVPFVAWRAGPAWRFAALAALAARALTGAATGRGGYAEIALVPFVAPAALPAVAVAMRRRVRWRGRAYP